MFDEKKIWEKATIIKGASGAVEVHVNILRLPRPLYSLQVCGAEASRFLRVEARGQGSITVKCVDPEELTAAVKEAIAWIQNDRQALEDEIIANAQKRESRFDRGKVEQKKTGKTERNRERKRGGVRE